MRTHPTTESVLPRIDKAPPMRHIVTWEEQAHEPPWKAICGYTLPMIEGWDVEKDRRPGSAADCTVCLSLAGHL